MKYQNAKIGNMQIGYYHSWNVRHYSFRHPLLLFLYSRLILFDRKTIEGLRNKELVIFHASTIIQNILIARKTSFVLIY